MEYGSERSVTHTQLKLTQVLSPTLPHPPPTPLDSSCLNGFVKMLHYFFNLCALLGCNFLHCSFMVLSVIVIKLLSYWFTLLLLLVLFLLFPMCSIS